MTSFVPLSLLDPTAGGYTFRNKFINGGMDIWQRGTSGSATGTAIAAGYVADRIRLSMSAGTTGSGTVTLNGSQQTFTPGQTAVPNEPTFFHRAQAAALGTQSGTTSYIAVQQFIESVRTLAGQTATISFWAKADTARTYALTVRQNFGSGGSPSAVALVFQTTFSLTTTFQQYTYTFSVPSISGKTIGTTLYTSALVADFILYKQDNLAFSDTLGAIGTYSTTPFLDLSQIQLEQGPAPTQFEIRPIDIEFQRCQRYFQTGTVATGSQATSTTGFLFMPLTTVMRIAPTVTLPGSLTLYTNGANVTGTPATPTAPNTSSVLFAIGSLSPATGAAGSAIITTNGTATNILLNSDF